MDSKTIIEKALSSDSLKNSSHKKIEENLYKKIDKYLTDLKFKPTIIKRKPPVWKVAADALVEGDVVFNVCTDKETYDTISYFHKFHGSLIYHLFHGKHVNYARDINGNFFHWTDCYKNITSYQNFSVEAVSQALNSVASTEKIKLIHIGDVDYDDLKNIFDRMDSVIRKNEPYIIIEDFLQPYDLEESYAKYKIKNKKFNLFETKKFKAFRDYISEKNINFDVVCSALPNDSLVLLKIKTS